MDESRFLQTVFFGGYDRTAVEEKFAALAEQTIGLENELRESKQLLTELQKGTPETKALEKLLAEERKKMTEAQAKNKTDAEKLKVLEDDVAARDLEIEDLKSKLKALQTELEDKSIKLTSLEANGDAEALSAVFIEAQKSADMLRNMAKKEAADLEKNSKKLADNVIAEANNTAKDLLYQAEKKSAELVADAQNRSAQMEAASENIRATALADVMKLVEQVTMLKQVFVKFQNDGIDALAEAEVVLNETKECMEAGGVPVFHEPILTVPAIPQAPTPEPVDHTYYADAEAAEEKAAEKQQMSDELKRLQAMADSLVTPEKKEKPEKKSDGKKKENNRTNDPIKTMVPDLAALAAQADALANGKK